MSLPILFLFFKFGLAILGYLLLLNFFLICSSSGSQLGVICPQFHGYLAKSGDMFGILI